MTIRINNIILNIEQPKEVLSSKIAKKLNVSKGEILNLKIIKESIDARKKDNIKFNYSVEVKLDNERGIISRNKDKDIIIDEDLVEEKLKKGNTLLNTRPVVIGFGPAGIFAALTLAQSGYKPIVFERGEDVDTRTKTVESFWNGEADLNLESNVQFGEGGAGAFSDGKLTTRIKDNRCTKVIESFIKAGAPKEIAYEGKPHIGTDVLKGVVKRIREEIINLGGEVHFNSKLEGVGIKSSKLNRIIVNKNEIPCEVLVLAIGHSSRDTYEMLNTQGIFMEPKAFAIGVRAEHPQNLINESQYGKFAEHPRLKAADYKLAYQSKELGRGIYSFCMCPGGTVVAAASEDKRLVTNGMSYHARNLDNANSALVVTVGPEDFRGNSPLKGMEFQRYYESLAYNLGGGDYKAPIQLIGDFLKDKKSNKIGSVIPSYKPGYEFKELKDCLPNYVVKALKEGIVKFDTRINGYSSEDAILTGIETRTSAPVRILRNEDLQSISAKGLYPTGEGAGFAGGIISAAVDGIKVAEKIIEEFKEI
jgi:uncharacterized FAD-dependent dehydrogenase